MTHSLNKGKRGEREAAQELNKLFPGLASHRGTNNTGQSDLEEGIDGVHHEVKRNERLNVQKAMDQSISDAQSGEVPIVMHKRSRKEWLVTLRLSDIITFSNKVLSTAQDKT